MSFANIRRVLASIDSRVSTLTLKERSSRSQELKHPIDRWNIQVLGSMTNLVVGFADFDVIDVDRVREKLINSFHAFADRLASAIDFSAISQAERDVFVDIVWIINHIVSEEEPKDKAKWEKFVNIALDVALIEQLPPLMRRETLLSLKSVTQGCTDTSTALKEALYPTSSAKRSRRVDSMKKLGALGQIFLKCGDFNAQKHICEMLYRLVLTNMLDQDVASTVFTHVSSQFKELLQIQTSAMMFKALKTLVRHYNTAQGSSATVRSFEADNLSVKGFQVHDNWVNFGQEMMTFYVSLDDDGGVEPVDVLYSNIRTFAVPERCVVHIGIREKPIGLAADDPFDIEDDEWLQITFQDGSISSLLEQLFRIGKQSTVVEMCLVNSNLIPSKKVSTGILDIELNLSPERPVVKQKPKLKSAPKKRVVKVTAPPDSVTESESSDEPALVTAPQPARTLPKRKAKQDGLKKMNEQLRDDELEDFELAEEPEPTASPIALRVPPPARQLKFTPAVAQQITSASDDESDGEAAATNGWTYDDIPALEKMIKAKITSKKQGEELQRVVNGLKSAHLRKSVFKTPAASLVAPKTGSRPAGILKSPDAKRLKTGPYDSAPDWKKRVVSVSTAQKEKMTTRAFENSPEINFDDDDDDISGGGTTTSLSNMFNASDDISPLLSAEKTKKKVKKSRTPTVNADISDFGDDMAGFQQMMQSLAERNRRIARERIASLVNEFKIESEAASRKIVAQIEQEYDAFARTAMRQVESRSRESAAVAAKVAALTADFKSALRAAYESFTANKRAAVADADRLKDELAALDAARAADVQKFLTKTTARRARVLADVDAAARTAKKNDGVKSMLLELARKM